MNTIKLKIGLVSFLLLLVFTSFGQETKQEAIKIDARSFNDSIMVRWVPLNYKAWSWGNKNGYKLKRNSYNEKGEFMGSEVIGVFQAIAEEEWRTLAETDYFALPVAGMLFGDPSEANLSMGDEIQFNNNRHGFSLLCADMSIEVSKALGWCYVDKDVQAGYKYNYNVAFTEKADDLIGFDFVEIGTNYRPPLPVVEDLIGEFGDTVVELSWKRENHYSGYFIEISEDGGNTYRTVNREPYVPMTSNMTEEENPRLFYDCKLPENFKEYHVRVKGRNGFGELSEPTNVIKGKGRPAPIDTKPIIGEVTENIEGQFDIAWVINDSYTDKVKGFNIYRSYFNRDNYEKINSELLTNEVRFFRDKEPEGVNFYYVEIIDENDHQIKSISALGQLEDNTPPAAPEWIGGVSDTSGSISLNWIPNTEADFLGYHVYVGNSRDEVFATYTSSGAIRDTFYMDTIEVMTLADSIYYKLKAIDFRGNFSPFSDILAVPRPDIIPPVPPVFNRKRSTVKGIELTWTNSSSDDALFTKLERRKSEEEEWDIIFESQGIGKQILYTDTTTVYKHTYQYRLTAEDEVGLVGNSPVISLKPIDTGKREKIENFMLDYNPEEKTIKLNWDYPADADQTNVVIYRSANDGSFTTYKKINRSELDAESKGEFDGFEFKDTGIRENSSYSYQIIINHSDGGYSPLSEKLRVEVSESSKRGKK